LANVGLSSVAGLENWVVGQLNAGGGLAKAGSTMLAMLNDFSNMTADATYGAAATTFNQKAANSQALSQTAGTAGGTYAAVSAVASAKTFTLTTGTDNVVGTSGGDTIDGQLNASGSQTYSAADAIDGGAGEDTLVIRVGAGTYVPNTLKNVETVSVEATGAAVLNVVSSSGIKTLKNAASSNTVEFRAVDATTAVEIANTASNNTVTYKSASLSGTTDVASIKVDGLTGTLTVADVDASLTDAFAAETIALTSTGTASTIGTLTLTSLGATKLTVAGEANLTVTARLADSTTGGPTVKTIDASAATGNINIIGAHNTASQAGNTITGGSGNDTLGGGDGNDVISGGAGNDGITAGAGVDNLTGGAGNDTFELAGNLTSSDTVDGGDGTDTLVTTGSITGTTGSKVSGVEIVSASGAIEISAASITGLTTLRSTSAAAETVTFSNLAGTETLQIRSATGDNATVNTVTKAVDGTADTQNVTIGNSSGTTAVVLSQLNANDAETINITSALVANTITTLASTDATKLTIAGLGLTVTNFTGSSALKTIDASTTTGAFIMGNAIGTSSVTITGGSANDTLIGSAGNDSISGGAGVDSIQLGGAGGNDTLSGGDGNDTFIFTDSTSTNDLTATDVISGGDGTDTLQFGSGTAGAATINLTTAGLLAGVSAVERLVLADTNTNQTLTIDDNITGIAGNSLSIAITEDGNGTQTVVNNTLGSAAIVTTTYSATTGVLNYTIGNSIDKVTGGAGTDVFTLGVLAYLGTGDVIDGSGGTADNLTINTNTATNSITAARLATVRNVEVLTIDDTDTDTDAYTVTLSNDVVAANYSGSSYTVIREGGDDGTLTVNAADVTGYALILTGADGADTLTGGSGNDTIYGEMGNDRIVLTSGGSDIVRFVTANEGTDSLVGFTARTTSTAAPTGVDRIVFQVGDAAALIFDGTTVGTDDAGEVNLSVTAVSGAVTNVATGDVVFVTGVVAGAETVGLTDNAINVITTHGYATLDAALVANGIRDDAEATAVNNTTFTGDNLQAASLVVLFYNTSTTRTELHLVSVADSTDGNSDNGAVTATATLLAAFTDISLAGIADLRADNFAVLF
jgi:Ca2+-binding RTX toxin-like protein